jgi:hypothetical protein
MGSYERQKVLNWIFWSTRESIDHDIPSITEIVETAIVVPLYWWIAIHFETYLLLLLSIVVAPLVLLRSDQAVALGIRWFAIWEKLWESNRLFAEFETAERLKVIATGTLSLLIIVLSSFLVLPWIVSGSDQPFWLRALVVGAQIVSAPTLASLGGMAIGIGAVSVARIAIAIIPITVFVLTGLIAAFGGGLALALVPAAMMVGLAFFRWLDRRRATKVIATVIIVTVVFGPIGLGTALGVFLVSLAIRILATLNYIAAGFGSLPRNFRRLVLCTSPFQEPQLIPGLGSDESKFTVTNMLHRFRERTGVEDGPPLAHFLFFLFSMTVWFIPAWLYRITLKSTAWFWWPLAYIGDDPELAKNPEEFRRTTIGSIWAWISLVLAIGTLLGFVYVNFFRTGAILQDNPLLTIAGYTLLVDWSSSAPWQLLVVVMAILGIAIVILVNDAGGQYRLAVRQQDATLRARAEIKLLLTEYVARVRLVLLLIFLLVSGLQALLYFNSLKCWFSVPASVERNAIWLYGDRMPRASCGAAIAPQ